MIAKIAVSAAVYAIDKPYDYRIPTGMDLAVGMRVSVPFGRSNRRCEGVVLSIEAGDETHLKPVDQVLDRESILDERALHMAAFLRDRYFCTFYDGIKGILPAGVWFQEQERYSIVDDCKWKDLTLRNKTALAVMQTLENLGGTAEEALLCKQFSAEALQGALQYLLRKKLICRETKHRRRVTDKTEQIARLAVSAEEAMAYAATRRKSAPVQYAVLELLSTVGECAAKELCYFTGATTATLNRLNKLGFLDYTQKETLRCPVVVPEKSTQPLVLNEEQRKAYEGLRQQSEGDKKGVALLYGVTGSGKTAVYIQLIFDCLAKGKSAILLVPEIALTPQLLSLFVGYFGEKVAVMHSGLRITERYDTWKRIRNGEATVVLGTRSAVFAPVSSLGLMIVDEEQEHTYKSENSPRYHAREVAIYRGAQENALVLLGSATPSIESMYRAKKGIYGLYTMPNRYNCGPLPPVKIIDMKRELKSGNASAISVPLFSALQENIQQGKQAILFLNRRGTSRMVACVECGNVPTCPGCSVHLTYHHANGRLMCHYCGYSEPLPGSCGSCGGHFKQIGFGTQKVQEQLEHLLPGTKILRMDADTVSAVNTHEKLFARFREENIPILLGTQMVAKGLNFENVTLVGVLDADASLYFGDYRGAEQTFSMITQVVGRAGRGTQRGCALVQSMTPQNQTIQLAAAQDYDGFYKGEIGLRQLRGCPPFCDLLTITFHGREEERIWQGAERFRAQLEGNLRSDYYREEQVTVLGPAPATVARINYNYRVRLTLSCRNTRTLRQLLSHLLREFTKDRKNQGIGVFADVNGNE